MLLTFLSAHTDPIFNKELYLLKLLDIYLFCNSNLPSKFDTLFSLNNRTHSLITPGTHLFFLLTILQNKYRSYSVIRRTRF